MSEDHGETAQLEREPRERRSDRAKMAPGATGQEYTVAYEFQLIDDASYPDLTTIPPRTMAARPAGEWNQSRLLVKGDRFEQWINGVGVLDGSLSSEPSRAGTAKRWAAAPTIRDIPLNAKPASPQSGLRT